MSVSEKRVCIQPETPGLSIVRQCELLVLLRSSYYRPDEPSKISQEDLELMRLIDEEYMRHPFYGSRKIRIYLKRQGYSVTRNTEQKRDCSPDRNRAD
jgi:putative transposase